MKIMERKLPGPEDLERLQFFLRISSALESKDEEMQNVGMLMLWPSADTDDMLKDRRMSLYTAKNSVHEVIVKEVDKIIEAAQGLADDVFKILDEL